MSDWSPLAEMIAEKACAEKPPKKPFGRRTKSDSPSHRPSRSRRY